MGFCWCDKRAFFCDWTGFFFHLQGFPQTVGLGEGAGESIHFKGYKQYERKGNIFGKMGDRGGIIQGDNSAGHCFVLMDLIPMNFFK